MAETYYAQSDKPTYTITVGELIDKLKMFELDAPVIFKSPLYGCFGSNTAYSVENVKAVILPRREFHIPSGVGFDDETGEPYTYEPETQVFHAWSGVVIS